MEIDKISAQILRAVMGDEPTLKPERKAKDIPGGADHWTPAVLLERGAYLRKMARAGNGEASETLREYPMHKIMLSFRSRNGEVEVHEKFADMFLILAGTASLVTGGTVMKPRIVAPGETRGDSIDGGDEKHLRQGEIVHVPAGTPHQFLVSSDKPVLSLVLKIQEAQ
jgi:mannose-6-phosphate isomerase-like protein (cupin superfamily)